MPAKSTVIFDSSPTALNYHRPGEDTDSEVTLSELHVLASVVVLGAAVVFLGGYPPNPTPHPVEKVLPNDKFQSH